MVAARRWLFVFVWSLAFLAACRAVPAAAPTPAVSPHPPTASLSATPPATVTQPAPTASVTSSPEPTLTEPLPTATSAPTATEPPASPTPQVVLTPTAVPPTRVPPPTQAASPTPCAFTWFVSNPPKECPGQAPIYSQTVAEHFEHGVLIWREKPDFYGSQIYAFFYDNKWPYWNPTNDQWRPTLPEYDPNIVPPAGFFQPVRGFGMFWRNAYFGAAVGSARDRLGWATDPEFNLGQLPMQCRISADRSYGCLVAGPDNLVFDIEPNNAWSLWAGTVLP